MVTSSSLGMVFYAVATVMAVSLLGAALWLSPAGEKLMRPRPGQSREGALRQRKHMGRLMLLIGLLFAVPLAGVLTDNFALMLGGCVPPALCSLTGLVWMALGKSFR